MPCNRIPDIEIVKGKRVSILELTVPFELNIENAHSRKCDKYAGLVSDIDSEGYECCFYAIEEGNHGCIDKSNENRFKSFFRVISQILSWPKVKSVISMLAILGSFSIYSSKKENLWNNPALLTPKVEMDTLTR